MRTRRLVTHHPGVPLLDRDDDVTHEPGGALRQLGHGRVGGEIDGHSTTSS
jgi:hypothetical protein